MRVRWLLSAAKLTQWQRPVASSKVLDILHWAIQVVWYWGIAMAIKMASKVGQFVVVVLFAVALAAAGVIWSKLLPDGGIQWLLE